MFGFHKGVLLLAVVAAIGTPCVGQSFNDMGSKIVSWQPDHRSSSFSVWKSVSIFRGQDGQMHKEVHEVKKETSGQAVKEVKVDCNDGRCQKSAIFLAPRQQLVQQPFEVINTMMGEVRAPMTPEALLERLQGARIGTEVLQREPPTQPQQLVTGFQPRNMPQGFLERHVHARAVKRTTASTACATGDLSRCFEDNVGVPLTVVALALMLGFLTMFACAKLFRPASARELPLQALAEPLAPEVPADAQAQTCAAVKESQVQPVAAAEDGVAMYLSRLYMRALA